MGEIPTQHLEVMAESFRRDGLNWHHVVIRATLDGIADLRAALRAAEKAREEADAYAGRANARIADLGERLDATEAVLRDAEKARKEAERELARMSGWVGKLRAAESRAARLLTALKHILKAFLMLHRACGTGSAEQWPEVEDARAAIAAEEGK